MSARTSLDDLPDEECSWCGKPYEARHVWQKYCCYDCRYASRLAFAKQVVRVKLAKLRCQRCGGPMPNAKKSDAKYCCIPCRTAARADRVFGRVADLRCVDCGSPIEGVKRRDAKLCLGCVRERHRKLNRERARRKRAEARARRRG